MPRRKSRKSDSKKAGSQPGPGVGESFAKKRGSELADSGHRVREGDPEYRGGRWDTACAVLLVLITSLTYAGSLRVGWHFDDQHAVIDNQQLRDPAASLGSIGSSTRSLTEATFALNYAIGGLDPWSYHLGNLLIHALAALCLFGWVRSIVGSPQRWLAFFAAALFAVHPLTTQSVTYVTQRYSSMAGLFFFASLWTWSLHRKTGRERWLLACTLSSLAAMMCKEMTVAIPIALLAADFTLHRPQLSGGELPVTGRWVSYAALAALLPVVPMLNLLGQGREVAELGESLNWAAGTDITRGAYFFSQLPIIVGIYLKLMLIPVGLNVAHSYSLIQSPVDLRALSAAAILTALLVMAGWAAFRARSQHWRLAGFSGLLFFFALGPTSTFVPNTEFVQEQRAYVSLAGVMLVLTIALWSVASLRAGRVLLLGACTIALALLTWERNKLWQSDLVLWQDAARKSPDSARAHTNLGRAFYNRNQNEPAVEHYRRSLELRPDDALTHNNLGGALVRLDRVEEAAVHFQEAVRLVPNFAVARNSLGAAYYMLGRTDEAIKEYREAVRLRPWYAEAQANLGMALARADQLAEAVEHYELALRHKPDYVEARYNYAAALVRLGRPADAITQYREVLRLDPRHERAKARLAQLEADSNGT